LVNNIGHDLGEIQPTLFAMMVIMALVTTIATTPILHWLHHGQLHLVQESSEGNQQASMVNDKVA
jgi:hypothetical protein